MNPGVGWITENWTLKAWRPLLKKVFSLQFQLVELTDDEKPANWNDLPKGVIVSSIKSAAKKTSGADEPLS